MNFVKDELRRRALLLATALSQSRQEAVVDTPQNLWYPKRVVQLNTRSQWNRQENFPALALLRNSKASCSASWHTDTRAVVGTGSNTRSDGRSATRYEARDRCHANRNQECSASTRHSSCEIVRVIHAYRGASSAARC